MALETSIKIAIDSRGARGGANQVNKALDSMNAKAIRTAKTFDTRFEKLRNQLMSVRNVMLGIGAALVLGTAIHTIGQFEDAMAGARAVTGATQEQFEDMTRTARELGATTKFSAAEAAAGMEFLGRAGFDANEIIAAMPGTLNLAAAGALELGSAADIASNIMSGFGIQAEEMTRVADVLAATAANSNTNVMQLGEGMKFAAPIAKSLGIELETTAAAMGVLANAGIQATLGGTGLRRVFASLVDPSKEAQKALKAYNIELADINPQTKSLREIFTTLRPVLQDTTAAFQIFQKQGASIAITLADNIDVLDELEGKLFNAEGAAEEMSRVMSDTLLGSVRQLKSAFDEFVLSTGDAGLTGALRGTIDTLTQLLRVLGGSEEAWKQSTTLVKALTVAVKALTVALGAFVAIKIAAFLTTLVGVISSAITAFTAATTAVGGLSAAVAVLGGPVTLIAGAIGAVVAAMIVWRNEIGNIIQSIGEFLGILDKVEQKTEKVFGSVPERRLYAITTRYNEQLQKVRDLEQQINRLSNPRHRRQREKLEAQLAQENTVLENVRRTYIKARDAAEEFAKAQKEVADATPTETGDTGTGTPTIDTPTLTEPDRFAQAMQDLQAQIDGTRRMIDLVGESEAAIRREEAAIEARRQAIELEVAGTEKEAQLKEKIIELTNEQIALDRARGLEKIRQEREETDALAMAVARATEANQNARGAYLEARLEQEALTEAKKLDVEVGSEQYNQLLANLRAIEDNNNAIRENISVNREVLRLREQLNLANEEAEERQAEVDRLLIQSAKDADELAKIYDYLAKRAEAAFDRQLAAARDWESGIIRAVRRFNDEATDAATNVENVMLNAADGMTNALTDFFTKGKADFNAFAQGILADINQILVKRLITNQIVGALFGPGTEGGGTGLLGRGLGNLLGGFANGGVAQGPGVAALGEGRFKREAVIPLPDGRNVPVKLNGTGQEIKITNNWNITTPDASSFQESEGQILTRTATGMRRAVQRNGGN